MILISGIAVISMVLFLIYCKIKVKHVSLNLNKKDHPLYFFYSVGLYLEGLFKNRNHLNNALLSKLKIYASVYVAILFTVGLLFFAAVEQLRQESIITYEHTIRRPKAGEGGKSYPLYYYTKYGKEELEVFVEEYILSGDERDRLLVDAYERLKQIILNGNSNFNHITQNLKLPPEIPGTCITVAYKIKPFEYMNSNGVILFDNITEKEVMLNLSIKMRYYDTEVSHELALKICSQTQVDEKSQLRNLILAQLEEENSRAPQSEIFQLPKEAKGSTITWSEKKNNNFVTIIFFGAIMVVLFPFVLKQQERAMDQKRKEQMLLDYPQFVSKLMLLINAGMTLRGAWSLITQDYQKRKQEGGQTRSLYEEMILTKYELDMGISEQEVYENFGRRCNQILFLRLGSILTQNLKRGNQGIATLLEEETRMAFVRRKENAKRIGEKASTKLLIPTAGMLIVVIAIIMVPAFMTL